MLIKKYKLLSLFTNNLESAPNKIIKIDRKRWGNRTVIQADKTELPLKYFYGKSANAIKIQIWVTLIANLLLMVMKKGLTHFWSFSGLATMMRITLMYHVDFHSLFNHPEKDWETLLEVNLKEDFQLFF